MDIPLSEGPVNLNWGPIMKTINDDPYAFFQQGGWSFLGGNGGGEEVRSGIPISVSLKIANTQIRASQSRNPILSPSSKRSRTPWRARRAVKPAVITLTAQTLAMTRAAALILDPTKAKVRIALLTIPDFSGVRHPVDLRTADDWDELERKAAKGGFIPA